MDEAGERRHEWQCTARGPKATATNNRMEGRWWLRKMVDGMGRGRRPERARETDEGELYTRWASPTPYSLLLGTTALCLGLVVCLGILGRRLLCARLLRLGLGLSSNLTVGLSSLLVGLLGAPDPLLRRLIGSGRRLGIRLLVRLLRARLLGLGLFLGVRLLAWLAALDVDVERDLGELAELRRRRLTVTSSPPMLPDLVPCQPYELSVSTHTYASTAATYPEGLTRGSAVNSYSPTLTATDAADARNASPPADSFAVFWGLGSAAAFSFSLGAAAFFSFAAGLSFSALSLAAALGFAAAAAAFAGSAALVARFLGSAAVAAALG